MAMISEFSDANRYYDADDAPGGNGTEYQQLLDQSGSNAHLTCAGAPYPIKQVGTLNGKATAYFDGTMNPLSSLVPFNFHCGFIVVRVNEANFSNYAGIFTGIADTDANGILVGNPVTPTTFFNFGTPMREYRLSDRIYPMANAPAPMNVFRIIYVRSWSPTALDGLRFGSDRSQPGRLAKMNLAFAALYSRSFCESDIRIKMQALATRYALPIADVFPYQADADSEIQNGRPANLDFPSSGGMIAETLGGKTLEADLKFTSRSNAETKTALDYLDNHYAQSGFVYRSYNLLPPFDSFGYATSLPRHSGDAAGRQKGYSFSFRGDRI